MSLFIKPGVNTLLNGLLEKKKGLELRVDPLLQGEQHHWVHVSCGRQEVQEIYSNRVRASAFHPSHLIFSDSFQDPGPA